MVEAGEDHSRTDNKRTKQAHGVKIKEDDQVQKIGGEHRFEKSPEWLNERAAYFDELYGEQQKKYDGKSQFCVNSFFSFPT
jgi:hypothetical protein